jgi:predicted Zn-dependent protease
MGLSSSFFGQKFGITERDLDRYLAEALARGADYADLYFEYLATSSISIDESIVKSATQGVSLGVGVRVISGERTGYAYSDDLSPEKILKAAATAACIADAPSKVETVGLTPSLQHDLYPVLRAPIDQPLEERVLFVKRADAAARATGAGLARASCCTRRSGHGLEADFNRKGVHRPSAGACGQQVASPLCTVVDDGTIAHRRGSLNVDDEGRLHAAERADRERHPARLPAGQAVEPLMKAARPTGSGTPRELPAHPMPRMTNTFMLAGESAGRDHPVGAQGALLRQLRRRAGGHHQRQLRLLGVGKLPDRRRQADAPVRGATLIGNGPEALKYVSMVGNDLKLDEGIGICGKEGQSVPVGVGIPPSDRQDDGGRHGRTNSAN